jgi:DNA-binding NtrC family response regulator
MGDVDKAVECMRMGAFDYLVKPVEPARLVTSVRRAIEMRALASENERLRSRFFASTLEHPEAFADIVARSPAMLTVFRYIEVVAASPQCVAITGETGVGKELVARAIHGLSGRKGKMVSVNVAGLDDHMFADTLFGHRRGAFTGADENRAGLVEKAEGGTLFLDEIGDLSAVSQVKLLRLLQEREYFRLGEDEPRVTNTRVVVATSRELKALQAEGKFRKDLFYRLMTHHIQLPPLRERLDDDLAILVDHFLGKAAGQLQKRKPVAPPELITLLRTYDFPGNVRELEAMIFDAVSRHPSGVLSLEAIRGHLRSRRMPVGSVAERAVSSQATIVFPKPLPTLRQTVELLIHEALTISSNNQKVAAGMLGITPQALGQRLKRRQESGESKEE